MIQFLAVARNVLLEVDESGISRAVRPTPVTTRASCAELPVAAGTGSLSGLLFREDSFDPVTRIRRGRIYRPLPGRTEIGNFTNWPEGPWPPVYIGWNADWRYEPLSLPRGKDDARRLERSLMYLGEPPWITPWRVVGLERVSTGEFLFTLRSASLMGALPRLAEELCGMGPAAPDRQSVEKSLSSLVDTYNRQEAVATVDAAREATRIILASWIGDAAMAKDLGNVIKLVPRERQLVVWAASVINRLHPRGKSAEQERQARNGEELRLPSDEDAGTCLGLVGMVLRDIGWAAR